MDKKKDSLLQPTAYEIFKRGSKTYFYSSWFFPKEVREDIFTLYAFVRVADDFVDSIPQDVAGFEAFVKRYHAQKNGEAAQDEIIQNFIQLEQKYQFKPEWTEAFLDSMRLDTQQKTYQTIADLEKYIYGSANVIGLFMSKILGLPEESFQYAEMLGKAMQYINFLRDINEDFELGRVYIPKEVIQSAGIQSFTKEALMSNEKEAFERLITQEIQRYWEWQKKAEPGFEFMPRRYRIPIRTASEMYKWTASRIFKNPQIVFKTKVKPSKKRIFARGMLEWIFR